MPSIDIIAGARPNFMKIAPIIRALQLRQASGGCLRYRLIHTGQHYDARMSGDFFAQLGIPNPDVNLGVGSGSQSEQTAAIMVCYEKLLLELRSDLCLVVGDVTSTMACAIVAQKLCVPVAHVESGIRSGDWTMPEEINRMVTDSITNWFFTTSQQANNNLRNAGVREERIFFVGNTMIDTLKANFDRLHPPVLWNEESLEEKQYFVLTMHRPNNVDEQEKLVAILNAISEGTRGRKIVFPVHPRTAKILKELDSELPGLVYSEPMGYLEFNFLVKNSMAVITDSGGITEEATVMGVPCLTLRDATERPETLTVGTNELVGTDPSKLKPALDRLFDGQWKKGGIPEKWDGKTGERICTVLEQLLGGE
ncbi:UDP-N-acetylglucosamine 2-epimerase (non-hydrolyzing) [bacterium]|nr:UDP-N-acetylglucosamine 2-epimerase (non-hydrolyzing) [bacterium]MDC0308999.1 UDP-N-acetylglucosamine 2-epimerase (non-hydrolyzing) [bacterium]